MGGGAWAPQNKGMKLTSVERIERSPLIPGVVSRTGNARRLSHADRSQNERLIWNGETFATAAAAMFIVVLAVSDLDSRIQLRAL